MSQCRKIELNIPESFSFNKILNEKQTMIIITDSGMMTDLYVMFHVSTLLAGPPSPPGECQHRNQEAGRCHHLRRRLSALPRPSLPEEEGQEAGRVPAVGAGGPSLPPLSPCRQRYVVLNTPVPLQTAGVIHVPHVSVTSGRATPPFHTYQTDSMSHGDPDPLPGPDRDPNGLIFKSILKGERKKKKKKEPTCS